MDKSECARCAGDGIDCCDECVRPKLKTEADQYLTLALEVEAEIARAEVYARRMRPRFHDEEVKR